MIGLFSPLLIRIVRLAKAHNITSIADFIAARYGKGQAVAATVALIAIVGTIPYIALQLKAVSSSLETILAHVAAGDDASRPLFGDIALFVALSMATFAVLFGTRHIDATEHQDGLMLAVAAELIVKLVAFLAVGIFVTFWMFDGPLALVSEAMQRPSTATIFSREPRFDTLIAMTLLSFVAFIMLPRQFHVAVVENNNEDEIKRAVWLYPVYLVLINLFVVPMVWAYTLLLPTLSDIGIVGERILTEGPWGLSMLRPQHLFGLEVPPLVHGVIWSLLFNILGYIGFSLHREPSPIERLQASILFRRT